MESIEQEGKFMSICFVLGKAEEDWKKESFERLKEDSELNNATGQSNLDCDFELCNKTCDGMLQNKIGRTIGS
jgi:hypothetical protein